MIYYNVPSEVINPVSADLVVEVFGMDPEVATEIKLCSVSDNSVVAKKISKGSDSFDMSLENILTNIFEIDPLSSGIVIDNYNKRSGRYYAEVNGQKSDIFNVMATRKRVELHEVISARNGITPMTHNDSVEIDIVSEVGDKIAASVILYSPSDTHKVDITTGVSAPVVVILGVSGRWLTQRLQAVNKNYYDYTSGEIVLTDQKTHTEITRKTFKLLPVNKKCVRLAWVNSYGGVDYYSFPVVKSKVTNVNKEKSIRGLSGRFNTVFVENQVVIQSEFLDPEMFEQVAGVISSHSVWSYEDGLFVPVRVSETQITKTPDKLQRFEITVVSQAQIEM